VNNNHPTHKLHEPSARVAHTTPVLIHLMVFEAVFITTTIAVIVITLVIITVVFHTDAAVCHAVAAHTPVHLLTTVAVITVLVVYNDKMSSHNRLMNFRIASALRRSHRSTPEGN